MSNISSEHKTLLEPAVWSNKLYTNGWNEGSADPIDIVEPATGTVLGRAGMGSADDIRDAATKAAAAQRQWAKRKPAERAAVLRRAGQIFKDNATELTGWIQRETGAISAKAGLEITVAANECYDAAALPHHSMGEVLSSDEDHWSFARRLPVGVVGVISPFNFPLILSIRSVVPALALGNAVVLKPDPRTAMTGGIMIARALEEAGLPAGVLQMLPGGGEAGAALTEAPEIDVVSFTGSTAAGRKVGEAAGRNLKRVHLELGGNNALVVLPGADIDAVASAGAFGSFLHQGQICMSTGRHLVHESIRDEYVEALKQKAENLPVGDPMTEQVALGPIIDERQRDNVDGLVQRSVETGAKLVAGGKFEGRYYAPTVITDLAVDNPAWTEEIFGPVAPVMSFSTIEDAAEIINSSNYVLSVGVMGD